MAEHWTPQRILICGLNGAEKSTTAAKIADELPPSRFAEVHMNYAEVQQLARETMDHVMSVLTPGMSLSDVREICEQHMHSPCLS